MLVFAIIYAILFAGLAWKKLNWAILLLLGFLPSYLFRFNLAGIPFTVLELMILIITLVWLIQNRKDLKNLIKEIRQNKFYWPIVAFFAAATIGVFVSPTKIGALGIYKAYFIEPIIFFFILNHQIKKGLEIKKIFTAIGISALYISILAIAQKLGLPFSQTFHAVPTPYLNADGSVDRSVSAYGYPNAVGLYLGPIIVWYVNSLWEKAKNYRETFFKWSVILLGSIAIITAQSAGAAIAVIAVSWLLCMFHKKTRIPAIILPIVVLAVVALEPDLRNFIVHKVFVNKNYSSFVRILIWKESLVMLVHNWFFGAGLDGYQTAIKPYHLKTFEIFQYPHNFILNFWSEMGIYGLAAFLWLTASFGRLNTAIIRKNGLAKSLLNLGLIAVMLQMLIHGLVDVPYFKNDLSVLFWTILAVASAV